MRVLGKAFCSGLTSENPPLSVASSLCLCASVVISLNLMRMGQLADCPQLPGRNSFFLLYDYVQRTPLGDHLAPGESLMKWKYLVIPIERRPWQSAFSFLPSQGKHA